MEVYVIQKHHKAAIMHVSLGSGVMAGLTPNQIKANFINKEANNRTACNRD